MRLAVYCDYSYRRDDNALWAEVAFSRFLTALADEVDRLTLVGRLDARPGPWHHSVPPEIAFAPLPYYATLADPIKPARVLFATLRRFWRLLDRVDTVWLLGPHPVAVAFTLLAALRGRPVALGVRQDLIAYVRNRHPHSRGLLLTAELLERSFRMIARRCAVVTVGSDLAQRYRHARRLLNITVSLVPAGEIAPPAVRASQSWDGELTILSVGRLDPEKNPLLLPDILARLQARLPRWRLVICGDGMLEAELDARLRALGVRDRAELRGYVPVEAGLLDIYRSSHVLLHCSWTEGVPQVFHEAFAQRLPVVATDVGGVREAVEGAAVLVPPGDAEMAAAALERIAADGSLRESLVEAGVARARGHSLEAETRRVARFLCELSPRASG